MKLGNIVPSTIEQDEIDVISESEDFEIAFNVGDSLMKDYVEYVFSMKQTL